MHLSWPHAFSVLFALRVHSVSLYSTPAPPNELYSPLIASKVLAIANAEPSPPTYPEYTDRTQGVWKYFPPTTWTSGFFPALLYLLDTRSKLCPSPDQPDWLTLGRSWSGGLVPLEDNKTLDHDVGFLSYPFQQELLVCVSFFSDLLSRNTLIVQEPRKCVGSDRDYKIRYHTCFSVQPYCRVHEKLGHC